MMAISIATFATGADLNCVVTILATDRLGEHPQNSREEPGRAAEGSGDGGGQRRHLGRSLGGAGESADLEPIAEHEIAAFGEH